MASTSWLSRCHSSVSGARAAAGMVRAISPLPASVVAAISMGFGDGARIGAACQVHKAHTKAARAGAGNQRSSRRWRAGWAGRPALRAVRMIEACKAAGGSGFGGEFLRAWSSAERRWAKRRSYSLAVSFCWSDGGRGLAASRAAEIR